MHSNRGIDTSDSEHRGAAWIPAFAGMTSEGSAREGCNAAAVHRLKSAATLTSAAPSSGPATTPPATAAISKEAAAQATEPVSFAGFRAVDVTGNRVDFSLSHTPTVVVYFWSASDGGGIKKTEAMENIYEQYHPRGVDVVGIASARSAQQLLQVCHDKELVWPQIYDSGGIASRYHVDPAKPYLILDQNRRVIATASSPLELDPVLKMLAQRRRLNQ